MRGKLFYFSRFFVRLCIGRWSAGVAEPEGPTVYVCSHNNLLGPLAALCWLPFDVRPWTLHVFLEREACRKQYKEYTFSRRFGMPEPLAAMLAWGASGYVSALMRSMAAIPVHRGTVKLGHTFRETVSALQAGESVLIFPDVDYTDDTGGIGEVYDGYLLIERYWPKVSAQPLRFVPLRLDTAARRITEGRAVSFRRDADWKTEMNRVREALRAEINRDETPQLRTEG